MGDLKTRIRTKFLRRVTSQTISPSSSPADSSSATPRKASLTSAASGLRAASLPHVAIASTGDGVDSQLSNSIVVVDRAPGTTRTTGDIDSSNTSIDRRPPSPSVSPPFRRAADSIVSGDFERSRSDQTLPTPISDDSNVSALPEVILEYPTPPPAGVAPLKTTILSAAVDSVPVESPPELDRHTELPSFSSNTHKDDWRPFTRADNQCVGGEGNIYEKQATQGYTVVEQSERKSDSKEPAALATSLPAPAVMSKRKVWVRRPGASATIVQVREDDLVDEVRDMILRKYGNSLGRTFDAPDILLRLVTRPGSGHKSMDRILAPEEEVFKILDQAYPGGQTVDEALIVDIPQRRTPRPSPRSGHVQHYTSHSEDSGRPLEESNGYFPPMPAAVPSPAAMAGHPHHSLSTHTLEHTRAMSVLNTGQVPSLPSPGATRRSHHPRSNRPPHVRQHTSSPTSVNASAPSLASHKTSRPRHDSSASDRHHLNASQANSTAALATPPILPHDPNTSLGGPVQLPGSSNTSMTPRVSSPGPGRERRSKPKKSRQPTQQSKEQPAPTTIPTILGLDTSVPPINVLIVEDNHINLKLLEQFIRRLKVRWATAVNGREAVNKWRAGGFHLVLMDIQLPIMSGLEATKEIRRLERVNSIGVFGGGTDSGSAAEVPLAASTNGDAAGSTGLAAAGDDKLDMSSPGAFKSPVIIVALTASNLQVDRHEALAAGCNDFLTKPVNFVWFERKVKEWGCMQALIDFDGWRMWKDFAAAAAKEGAAGKSAAGSKTGTAATGAAGGVKKGPAGRNAAALRAIAAGGDSTPDHSSG